MSLGHLGLQKTSLVDYPGLVSAVLFTHGCNLSCGYCHNPHLIWGPHPQDFLTQAEVLSFLDKRRDVLGGVVITGGEPLLHVDLPDFVLGLKERYPFKIKVDTNGTLPQMLPKIAADYVAMDLKLPIDEYRRVGYLRSLKTLSRSIAYLRSGAVPHEFRTVWIPGWSSLDSIPQMARELGEGARLFVAGFRPGVTLDPEFSRFAAPLDGDLDLVVQRFRDEGVDASLRKLSISR